MVKASVTRASHKRRLHEKKINSAKKAKVKMMKELVVEYNKIKSLNNNVNNIYCTFQSFYDEKKYCSHNRSKWCNYENFDRMYNLVYEAME